MDFREVEPVVPVVHEQLWVNPADEEAQREAAQEEAQAQAPPVVHGPVASAVAALGDDAFSAIPRARDPLEAFAEEKRAEEELPPGEVAYGE